MNKPDALVSENECGIDEKRGQSGWGTAVNDLSRAGCASTSWVEGIGHVGVTVVHGGGSGGAGACAGRPGESRSVARS